MKTKNIITAALLIILTASTLCAEVSLTVYQRDLVLVRDVRTVDLKRGENRIVFDMIAPDIDEATLRIAPVEAFDDIKTIEQSYEYDLADQDRIWRKFLGKPFQFTKDDSTYRGILRNFDDDRIYLEPEGKRGAISLIERSGIQDMTFDSLPEGLVLQPEIVWKVRAGKRHHNLEVEISYLANGITWQTDYTALVLDDTHIRLQGNLTLTNSLDMDFPDARLDLIAGHPHRSFDPRRLSQEEALAAPGTAEAAEPAEHFFEYRRYRVPQPTTLHASQTKGIPLIEPSEITCDRNFFYDGSSGDEEVMVRLLFDNTGAAGLGIALPAGDLLMYQADESGEVKFLGEDHLDASSPGDKVELVIGRAFDLRVDRKRISHQRISRNRTRDTVEIVLASSREKPAEITVRERLYGFWEVVEAKWAGRAVDYRAEDANRIEFDVKLEAGSSDTLRYTVEYGY